MLNGIKNALIIPSPAFKLKYAHNRKTTDISKDISNDAISVTYSDNGHAKSDSLNITIQNTNLKWMDSWKPDMGDKLELTLGYEEDNMAICGSFEICDICLSSSPDTISITAEATKYTDPLRAERFINFNVSDKEGDGKGPKRLKDILNEIIKSYQGYEIIGINTVDNLKISTIQDNKSDLEYLKKLADSYGYFFKINYDKLIFYKKDVWRNKFQIYISRKDVKSYSFSQSTTELYRSVAIIYQDTDKQEFKECKITDKKAKAGKEYKEKIFEPIEDSEAQKMAENIIKEQNKSDITGNLDIKGDPKFASGLIVNLKDFFKFDGEYIITSVTQSLSRNSGYTTKLNITKKEEYKLSSAELTVRELMVSEKG